MKTLSILALAALGALAANHSASMRVQTSDPPFTDERMMDARLAAEAVAHGGNTVTYSSNLQRPENKIYKDWIEHRVADYLHDAPRQGNG